MNHFKLYSVLQLVLVLINLRSGVLLNMFIDTNEGSDKDNNCSNVIHPCYSLEHVANLITMAEYKQNISIEINSFTHVLINRSVEFHNVVDLSITGKTTNGTRCIVRCDSSEGLGISFNRCSNVALHNFTITGCGQYSANNAQYKVAVEMYNVTNLTVSGMVFKDNTGYGLLVNNSGGVIEVYGSWFINNSITSCYYGSGGMLIIAPWYRQYNNTVFNISHSHFYNNHNDFNKDHYYNLSLAKKGGGLRIEIFSNVTRNILYVYYCRFKKNFANNGGGFYLEAHPDSTGNTVVVSNCSFQNNEAYQGGGGADIGSMPINNQFLLTDCYFMKNKARWYGGAVALYSSSGKEDTLDRVRFSSCIFIDNQANGGAAVDVNHAQNQIYENTYIIFDSCSFINNTAGRSQANQSASSIVIQSGVFFIREVNVSFYGMNSFINNTNTALYCASATITFKESSYTEFVGNTGGHGGAILLVGDAQLSFRDSTTVIFKRNTAAYGGAICAIPLQTQFIYFTDTCFIQHHENKHTASIMFDSNIATTGIANDVFASTLWPCTIYSHKYDFKKLFNSNYLANFKFNNGSFDDSSSVATAVRKLSITDNTILIFPGIPYHINVTQHDEFKHEIKALYPLSAKLYTSHKNIKLDTYSATLTNNTITVVGDINTTGTIILETIVLSNIQKTVNVTIVGCPAGYYYNNSTYKCHCSQPNKGYYGISRCHINHSAIIDIGLWAGYLDDRQFYTGVCSAHLCSYKGRLSSHGQHALPLVNVNKKTGLEEYVCASNRQGTLCGICTDNYSTLYHSPSYRCSKCSDTALKYGILLYVASELLPVTAIFLVILLLDIRLTSGAFYTLIFYAQVLTNFYINAFGTIHISEGVSTAASAYHIVYGILNFDILNMEYLSFCLWPNATMMHIFMIKYITTLYALLLVILTVLILKVNSLYTCIKLCHRLGRRDIRGCIINALSAFLVLCYSQCVHITFSILVRVQLVTLDSSKPTYVPLFNGELKYMESDHLYFAMPAILCLFIIVLPPPLILLIEPLIIKVNNIFPRKMSYFLLQVRMKMKPFLDSFQGCFKDSCRGFAGLYFLYRTILYLPVVVTSRVAIEYMTAEGILFVILLCHTMVQPFQNKWHNRLDICLLLNLLAVNTLTIISYYSLQWEYSQWNDIYVLIQLLLMTMPLIYICGYFCHYAFSFVKQPQVGTRSRCSMQHEYSNIEDGDDSLPARLLNENMLSLSYNSLDS